MAPDLPVPRDLRGVLIKFVMDLLKDKVTNEEIIDFGIRFFNYAKTQKQAEICTFQTMDKQESSSSSSNNSESDSDWEKFDTPFESPLTRPADSRDSCDLPKRKRARDSWWLQGKLSAEADQIQYEYDPADLDEDFEDDLEDDQVADLPQPPDPDRRPVVKAPDRRRHSVSAEVYDPSKAQSIQIPHHPKDSEEEKRIIQAIKDILIFRALDRDAVNKVINALYKVDVREGDDVISQGSTEANEFYIVDKGVFEAFVTNLSGGITRVAVYDNQGSFGELALMYHQPRAATVTAKTDGRLWAMDRETFRYLVLNAAFAKREHYMKLIANVDFFAELKNYERQAVCDALEPVTFKAGQKILSQGDIADGMYFVESGGVVVTKMIDGIQKELGHVGPGGYFGELALLTKKPRQATVAASGEFPVTKMAFLDAEAFERLLGPCMSIMKRNMALYEKQVHEIFGSSASHGS